MDRFIKVMCTEEDNLISALIIDQFFKTLLTKIDFAIQTKDAQMQKYKRMQDAKVYD